MGRVTAEQARESPAGDSLAVKIDSPLWTLDSAMHTFFSPNHGEACIAFPLRVMLLLV